MKILYIGGATRSGSTLTEMILGNHPDFFSVGEVRYFWEHLHQENIRCGCGKLLRQCDFWSQVIVELKKKDVDFERMYNMAIKLDRTRNLPWLSSHLKSFQRSDIDYFVSGLTILYQSIQKIVGDKVVIDSSKIPSHIYLLGEIPEMQLRILHLVRDGRAVAYSWNKRRKQDLAVTTKSSWMPQRSLIWAIGAWAVENYFVSTFSKTTKHYSQMRYEDFARSPSSQLNRILDKLGFPNNNLKQLDDSTIDLVPNHSVNGNPLRFKSNKIKIVPDFEWQKAMPRSTQALLGLLVSPILAKFQYKI